MEYGAENDESLGVVEEEEKRRESRAPDGLVLTHVD